MLAGKSFDEVLKARIFVPLGMHDTDFWVPPENAHRLLANGGELDGVRILKAETVKLMHTNQLPDAVEQIHPRVGNPGNTFGIDFAIVDQPDGTTDHTRAQGEFWWYGAGGTWFGVNPVQDLVIIGMIQSQGTAASHKARLSSKMMAYEAIEE